MIWTLLALHVALVALVGSPIHRLGRRTPLVAGIAPAAATLWAISRLGVDEPAEAVWSWVPGLDLELAFRVGPTALVMTLLVSGIGTAIMVYTAGYFSGDAPGLGRFTATLLAFSTAMLGLVWSDSVWTLFLFWELTSITSFLLVGHKNAKGSVRTAARRALLITAAGGLALLAGLLLVAAEAGSSRLSEMGPVTGSASLAPALLVMVAAATKSAQLPFHVWLPGAMAAPTPVSAYLHSATMVKAGILLVALLSPVLTDAEGWRTAGLAFGVSSMVWGAVGALRHRDGKLILAWGTISQLGLLMTLLSAGTAKATFAGVSILVAHAVFKATLFMMVGEIDVRTGTRDITKLDGLWRSMPVTFVVAVVAGASMAGVPPVLGFAAKEAAVEASLKLLDEPGGAWVAVAILGGSVLTVAYTFRLLLGLFGPARHLAGAADDATDAEPIGPTEVAPARPAMSLPLVVLGSLNFIGFLFIGAVNDLVVPMAESVRHGADHYVLYRWPGITTGLMVSFAVVGAGLVVGWGAYRLTREAPRALGARNVDEAIDGVIAGARRLTGSVQHGSLPVYMVTMALTSSLAAAAFIPAVDFSSTVLWDDPAQPVLAVLILGAAAITTLLADRLGAALAVGAVGVGVAGLFLDHGAPDLALTQLLVETVIVVGFVFGLGSLTRTFPRVGIQWRAVRLAVSGTLAGMVGLALIAAGSNPVGEPPIPDLLARSADEGGGNNAVNVILTDIRALDTMGEIVVLAVAAMGILALTRAADRTQPTPEVGR